MKENMEKSFEATGLSLDSFTGFITAAEKTRRRSLKQVMTSLTNRSILKQPSEP